MRERKEMRWDENGQRNLVNPWRVSWNDWSFKLSFLPGPWRHRTFWSFFFWHPKNSSHKASMLFFSETWGIFFNNTHTHTPVEGTFAFVCLKFLLQQRISLKRPWKFLLCIFQHKGFPQQPLRSRLCGVQRPHFWSSDFNGLPGPAAKGGEDSGGTGHMKEIARVIELFSEPWLWTKF